eukprot:14288488-Alexandrium_andersonii.AAC.1
MNLGSAFWRITPHFCGDRSRLRFQGTACCALAPRCGICALELLVPRREDGTALRMNLHVSSGA